ncbi:MAG TPA: response regulator [Candidatus Polarisedimenticolia bacterium]|nr:response regulator [Candidatus Polarisedimenticolia bacterium]
MAESTPTAIRRLRQRLAEAEQTLRAIREGEVDAVVVSGPGGPAIYTLQGAETPYRVLVERMGEGAATLTESGTILYCNQRFAEMLGASLDSVPGTDLADHLEGWDKDRLRGLLAGAGGATSLEGRLRSTDGRVPVQLTFDPMPPLGDSEPMTVLIATDLTSLKSSERTIQERSEELERRAGQLRALVLELSQTEQRERKRLAQILHDQFQQLLVAAQLQMHRLDAHVAARGRAALGQLRALLEDALRASREVTLELSPAVLHQSELAPALRWLARWFEQKHGLPVAVRAAKDAPRLTEPARLFLFTAARELLMNVVKHARAGSAAVSLLPAGDSQAVLAVEDDGIGMSSLPGAPASEGLGLFSIQERLGMLGGRLEIARRAEGGTRVRLVVPLGEHGAAQEASGREATYLSGAPLPSIGSSHAIRVLIVDDHEMVRQGFGALLSGAAGIKVVGEAANGAEAIVMAQRLHPDVILMDVNMPVMDGVEASRHITARWPDILIIGLSMHAGEDMLESMHQAGAAAYVTKDKASSTLCEVVRTEFRRRHPSSPASSHGEQGSARG